MATPPEARKRPASDKPSCSAAPPKKRARYQFGNIADYEMLKELGEGTFGVVYKARDRRTGAMVAVKWVRGDHGGGEDGARDTNPVIREAGCLGACRDHPNIVQIKNVVTDKSNCNMVIVMEFVGPSLRSFLTRPFSEDETRRFMRQLLAAAEKMHSSRTIHRDIKPENILVSPSGALKLCDFGSATPTKRPGTPYPERRIGTLQYYSPEQLAGMSCYGPAVDMWALGCVMAELLLGAPLFTADKEEDILEEGIDLRDAFVTMELEEFDDWPMELSVAGREVLAGLLSYEDDERLTAADALKHRWFTEDEEAVAKAEYPGFVPMFSQQ